MNLPPIIVLAGGMGTRVAQISGELPKNLIPINGVPFVQLQLQKFIQMGIKKAIFCVGYKEEYLREFFQNNFQNGIQIEIVSDGPTLLGTGGAIKNAIKFAGSEFLVTYGDSYLDEDFEKFYEFAKNFQACLTYYHNMNTFEISNISKIAKHRVWYEKKIQNPQFEYVDYGLLYFKSSIFDITSEKHFDLSNLLTVLSQQNLLYGYEVFSRFYEIGSVSGISELEVFLKQNE